jgi:thiol-disulfide isomerase/thioredoxin
MQKLLALIFVLTSFTFLFAQDTNKVIKDEESGKPMLVGHCTKETFSDSSFAWWFNSGYRMYKPDSVTVNKIKQNIGNVKTTIVMGTWCSDSREHVPHFFKIMDEADYPERNITLICVDRDKKTASGNIDSLKIELVPTFIFYRNGKEIGRIEESPTQTFEADVYAILKSKD